MNLPKIQLNVGTNTIQINTIISPSKFELKYNKSDVGEPDEAITIDDYFENKPNNEIKPISAITLRSSEIKAAGQTIYDDELIEEYGVNELIIEEDYIAYTDTLRNIFLEAAKELFGLTYKPLSIDLLGNIYLDFNDILEITDSQNNVYTTYALNNVHEYNGTLYNTISVPALSEVEEKYKYEPEDITFRRKTAAEIDKANGKITLINQQIGDRSEKTSTITEEIDRIELKISDIEDLTLEVIGNNPIELKNCLEGNLIQLKIIGNNTVFSGLKPSDTLVPQNTLVPYGDSLLHIYSHNLCYDIPEYWENASYERISRDWEKVENENVLLYKDYIPVESTQQNYFSLEGNYVFGAVYAFDENKNFIRKYNLLVGETEREYRFSSGVKYVKPSITQTNTEERIYPENIIEVKPMVTYSEEKLEYTPYYNKFIDLHITEPLRQYSGTVYDEFIYDYEDERYKAKVVRRVGVTEGGELYELANEIIEPLDIEDIIVVSGTNYIDIETDYTANLYAKYVQRTEFTKQFATTYQVESMITQLANQITLLVREKVNKEEVIAELNLEIAEGKGIVRITGNQVIIDSDYFHLTADGKITATSGTIGNLRLYTNTYGAWLNKTFQNADESVKYQSGLFIPDSTVYLSSPFLYAGLNLNESQAPINANAYITHYGKMYAKWFEVNGESGYLNIKYNSGRIATTYDKDGMRHYLDNENNNQFMNLVNGSGGTYLHLFDSPGFTVTDMVHNSTLLSIKRYRPEAGINQPDIDLWVKTYYWAGGSTGYEIATVHDISDEKLKKDIKNSEKNALEIINKIKFKQFIWNETTEENGKHIEIGIIAQDIEKIDKNYVQKTTRIYKDKEEELLSINTLNLLTTTMKAVQELSEIVKQQQEEIKQLKNEINKLKGEE